ncbi:hypothetical protein LguiA_007101 [Lonicera macranthoides]
MGDSIFSNQERFLTLKLTRDLKLLPKSVCGALTIWRTCRNKIYEIEDFCCFQSRKARTAESLGKALPEEDIHEAEKEAKRENKLLVKESERNQREIEKEKKGNGSGTSEGKIPNFYTMGRLVDVTRRVPGIYSLAKRLQDEAEKEQNRREKEEAALRKQASLMEHFHKRSTNSSSTSHNVRMHLISWHNLGRSIRSNWKQHLGDRQKPKTELVQGT